MHVARFRSLQSNAVGIQLQRTLPPVHVMATTLPGVASPTFVARDQTACHAVHLQSNAESDGDSERFWRLRGYGGSLSHWEGLLPTDKSANLDNGLRKEIMKYADLSAAAYDAVHPVRTDSKFTGLPKWAPNQLMRNSSVLDSSPAKDYTVLKYLYNNVGVFNLGTSGPAGLFNLPDALRKFFEAKDLDRRKNLVGFIAISPKDAEGYVDLAVVVRGTMFVEDWVYNIAGDSLGDWLDYDTQKPEPGGLKLHAGFSELYCEKLGIDDVGNETKLWSLRRVLLETWIPRLLRAHKVRTISTTGHSLGGALATLMAYDVNEWLDRHWHDKYGAAPERPRITVFSFASPRLGNIIFQERFNQACGRGTIRHLRVVNGPDGVPNLPGFFNTVVLGAVRWVTKFDMDNDSELDPRLSAFLNFINPWRRTWGYNHVGRRLRLDSGMWGEKVGDGLMRRLKLTDVVARHSLEVYAWLLATQYGGEKFKARPVLASDPGANPPALTFPERDYVLLNKYADLLAPKWGVAPSWGLQKEPEDTPVWDDPVLDGASLV